VFLFTRWRFATATLFVFMVTTVMLRYDTIEEFNVCFVVIAT